MIKSIKILLFLIFTLFCTLENKAFASENDLYSFTWLDKDKEVYVLQNRLYRKDGRLYINVNGGVTTSGAFVNSLNIQGRIGFFFKEEWGLEALYSKNMGKENPTALDVRNVGGSGSIPFRRIIQSYTGAMLVWAPFYSKLNAFNKVFYMDWMFGLGFATLNEENNRAEVLKGFTSSERSNETHSGLMWEISSKFYLSQNWEIRTDLTAVHFKAEKVATADKVFYSNWDFGIGIGYSF